MKIVNNFAKTMKTLTSYKSHTMQQKQSTTLQKQRKPKANTKSLSYQVQSFKLQYPSNFACDKIKKQKSTCP
jgi:hypothetical protein